MTQEELYNIIDTTLKSQGMQLTSPELANNSYGTTHYIMGSELYRTPVEGYDFTHLSGWCVEVSMIGRHNGTDTDVNYQIEIMQWENSSGHREHRLKVLHTQSPRLIEKNLKNFCQTYLQMIQNVI